MSQFESHALPTSQALGHEFRKVTDDERIISAVEKMLRDQLRLTAGVEDARLAMHQSHDCFRVEALDWMKSLRGHLEELRSTRMSAVAEIGAITRSLADVREFFLGKDHDVQIARLREFVRLCEQLQKLKESGFLDVVADTMLKLA